MTGDSLAWRCPVCDGVNHGGRVCTTCGESLPEGFVPRDATRHAAPASGAPPTVVPAPRPRRAPTFDDVFGPVPRAGSPAPREPMAPGFADFFRPAPSEPVSREESRGPSFADLFRPAAPEPVSREEPRRPSLADLFRPVPPEPAPRTPSEPRERRERREPKPPTFDDIFGPEY